MEDPRKAEPHNISPPESRGVTNTMVHFMGFYDIHEEHRDPVKCLFDGD